MNKKTFLTSSLILIIGEFLTKFLGFVYLGPLNAIDPQIGLISSYLMVPYSFFLMFAIVGLTNVMTQRFTVVLGDKKAYNQELINSGFYLVMSSLVMMFFLMFFSYPLMKYSASDASYVSSLWKSLIILSLSIPFYAMSSYIRAICFAHGKNIVVSVTYIIEQVVKILFMLPGSYILLNVLGYKIQSVSYVIGLSILVSVISTFVILVGYAWKEKLITKKSLRFNRWQKDSVLVLFSMGIIYFINSIFITGFQMVDQLMFPLAYKDTILTTAEVNTIYAEYFFWDWKFIMLAVGVGSVFITMMVRFISSCKDKKTKAKEFDNIFELVIIYSSLAMIFFMTAGQSFYVIFYNDSVTGLSILFAQSILIPAFIVRTLLSVYALIRKRVKLVILSVIVMFFAKIILNILFFNFFYANGFVYSSFLATIISSLTIILLSENIFIFNKKSTFSKINIFLRMSIVLLTVLIFQEIFGIMGLSYVMTFILSSIVILVIFMLLFKNYISLFLEKRKT